MGRDRVNNVRDAVVHFFEKAGIPRSDAFMLMQAIERFIDAKIQEPK
jgi:hypothetical protein